MNPLEKLRESAKRFLSPYPALFGPARRIYRWLYQRLSALYLWVKNLLKRRAYKRQYRAFWEGYGIHMQEHKAAVEAPGGRWESEKKLIVDEIAKLKPSRVLDFGCGYGRVLKSLHERLAGALVFGCDIDFSNLERSRAYLSDSTATVFQADGRFGLPLKDKSFDVVFTCGVLAHVPPPQDAEVRRELLRVAKRHIVHCELISEGVYNYCYDNRAIYGSMGYDAEELPYPLEQKTFNRVQFVLVHLGSKP